MQRFLHWLFAYMAVGLSAGLAAWSGMKGADATWADAGIKGAIMFVIAILGCHGWSWAARLGKDGHRRWAVASWFILSFALAVTLLGSAGSFYSAATARIGTAERGSDAYTRADAELKRIEARRKKLTTHRSVGEIEPDIESAKTDRRYKVTQGCHPDHTTKSKPFCDDFRNLEQEKAAAEEAQRLDRLAAPHLATVGKGRPTAYGGPGDILAAVLGVSQQMGNAIFSLMCTLALDFGAVMALVTAELRSPHPQPAPAQHPPKPQPKEGRVLDRLFSRRRQEPEPVPVAPIIDITPEPEAPRVPERPRPRLAISQRQPIGAVLDFLHHGVDLQEGPRTDMVDAFIAYQSWCSASGLRAMTVAAFVGAMTAECKRFGIRIVHEDGKHWLVNVQLRQSVDKVSHP